ncbi:hypothetical protein ANN_25676 [Periplaneta americana]|uniref:Uncharacterized protein n=1 Tax=Periplaneta americana TaxID=6978 RepID=A0ABQ8S3U6_PERAM|nr:hypothetical protein ANN_25676 [Periplaneta americana]
MNDHPTRLEASKIQRSITGTFRDFSDENVKECGNKRTRVECARTCVAAVFLRNGSSRDSKSHAGTLEFCVNRCTQCGVITYRDTCMQRGTAATGFSGARRRGQFCSSDPRTLRSNGTHLRCRPTLQCHEERKDT